MTEYDTLVGMTKVCAADKALKNIEISPVDFRILRECDEDYQEAMLQRIRLCEEAYNAEEKPEGHQKMLDIEEEKLPPPIPLKNARI